MEVVTSEQAEHSDSGFNRLQIAGKGLDEVVFRSPSLTSFWEAILLHSSWVSPKCTSNPDNKWCNGPYYLVTTSIYFLAYRLLYIQLHNRVCLFFNILVLLVYSLPLALAGEDFYFDDDDSDNDVQNELSSFCFETFQQKKRSNKVNSKVRKAFLDLRYFLFCPNLSVSTPTST